MAKNHGILVVDVGTTKICAMVGEFKEDGLWITGMGVSPSYGLKKGVVIDIEEATTSIREAVDKALTQSKADLDKLITYTSIAGTHIKTTSGMGTKVLKEQEVTYEDVRDAIEIAQAGSKSEDRRILHALPKEFVIDHQKGIINPVGMTGKRLEVHVNLITCNASTLQNLLRCFQKLGLEVNGVVFQGLASAEAVLTPEEKDLGVIVIDFGGGTTDVVAYWNGVLRLAFSLPVGGELLTNDLAIGLRTSKQIAEEIKKEKGVCLRELVNGDEIIEVPGIGNRPVRKVNRQFIAEILELRVKELFELVARELKKYMLEETGKLDIRSKFGSGIVLTGGSSQLPGLILTVDQMFDLPTRIGLPSNLNGIGDEILAPQFSTAVGMFYYAKTELESEEFDFPEGGLLEKLKRAFGKFFKK
ncbi:MAG: cell division protein FtsA [Thermodesulfobacteria bacterium]|nr:cell division protein FtsA [Thermodesulfobacteriota bacterium]